MVESTGRSQPWTCDITSTSRGSLFVKNSGFLQHVFAFFYVHVAALTCERSGESCTIGSYLVSLLTKNVERHAHSEQLQWRGVDFQGVCGTWERGSSILPTSHKLPKERGMLHDHKNNHKMILSCKLLYYQFMKILYFYLFFLQNLQDFFYISFNH